MILYHATPKANAASITMQGLDPAQSQGKLAAVWLHSTQSRYWAVQHTVLRHGCEEADVWVYEVRVPRSWLKRAGHAGLWNCDRVIGPDRLTLLGS